MLRSTPSTALLLVATAVLFIVLPPPGSLEYQTPYHSGRNSHPTDNRHAHQTLLRDLVVDQALQTRSLHVGRFMLQQGLVISPRLCVVPQLEVPQRQIVQALPSAFWSTSVDLG